jgi:FtsP/CotA-like multicopper oxidase with cupredoxin domain/YHS domain-containing protein
MRLDPAEVRFTSEFEGETYSFCSPGCEKAFGADPRRYIESSIPARGAAAHDLGAQHGEHGAAPDSSTGAAVTGAHGTQAAASGSTKDQFTRDASGLPDANPTAMLHLRDGETLDMRATPVRKRIDDAVVKMLGYNSSIPGPTLRLAQGTEITVLFRNEMELETTVHWHGLRHENRFDGVPTGMHEGVQTPVPPGGSFMYRLQFPDAGIFWYHPHLREDYAQEHGLYGSIVVAPADPSYWPPANREVVLMLDDILIENGQIAPFSRSGSDHTAMGRFGNVMLVNGETDFRTDVRTGEVVRLYVTNTANTRFFNVRIPGARMKLVGADNGRVEHEAFVEEVLVTPSERAVVDVLFERAGRVEIEHRTPEKTYVLATVDVSAQPAEQSYAVEFGILRSNPELLAERTILGPDLKRDPDKSIALVGIMPGMAGHGDAAAHGGGDGDTIEWEDTMERMNRMSTPHNMLWKLVDRDTGAENNAIAWDFRVGDRVKIRIVNDAGSDHPMPHPFHIHGERFLVLSRDGVPNPNLVWKDTVLVDAGEQVDILMDASNPGVWMAHCHIAEHLEGGMMFSFRVHQ